MNWSLLFPSTWNPLSAFRILILSFSQESQIDSKALSDSFIFVTIIIAFFFGVVALYQTIISWNNTKPYLKDVDVDEIAASNLPLFREMNRYFIQIPSRDGSERTALHRTVDAAEVFRDSTLAPNFTTSRLFLAVPGILTGIGVLGTFIGLQMGIGGLDMKDLKNLETSIVPLIQGCAIAFSTSVWGVGASLVFSLFEKFWGGVSLQKIRKLQDHVDALIPRYVPEEAMAELERASRGTENILKGLAVAIGEEMQKAIGRLGQEIKDSVAEATSESQGPLMEKSAKLITDALTAELANFKNQIGDISDQFSKSFSGANDKLMKSVNNMEPTVKTLSESVSMAQHAVKEAVDKLNAHESVMEQMATAATEVRLAAEAFAMMKESMQLSVARNENAAQAQLSAAKANEQVAEKFGHIGERLPEIRQTLEDASRVIASIGEPIADLKTYLEKLPDDQEATQKKRDESEEHRNTRLLSMTGELADKVGKAAEQFTEVGNLADKLSAAAESLDDASNELATFGSHVIDASKAQRDAADSARAAALSGERTASALEPLPSSLAELTSELETAGTSVRKGAEATADSYRELINLQVQWNTGAEIGLNAMKDRLQEIITAYGDQVEGQTRDLINEWTTAVNQCLTSYETQVVQLQEDLDELQDHLSKQRR